MVSPIRSESNQHGESGHAYQSAEVFSVTRTLSPSRISRSPASFRDHPSRFRKVSVSHSRTIIYIKKSTHLTRKIIQRLCPLHDLFLLSLLRFWFWLRLWHGRSRDTAHGRRRKGFLRRKRRWRVHRCRRCALRGRRSAQRAEHSPSGRYVHISEFLPPVPHRGGISLPVERVYKKCTPFAERGRPQSLVVYALVDWEPSVAVQRMPVRLQRHGRNLWAVVTPS